MKETIEERRQKGEAKDLQTRSQWAVFHGRPIAEAYNQRQTLILKK